MSKEKTWLTLNAHGKKCLKTYVNAISGTDILTTQLDYLNKKGLTDFVVRFSTIKNRMQVAGECLTDLGIETVKHYFPKHITK